MSSGFVRLSQRLDLTGKRYGMLTAIKDIGAAKDKNRLWNCRCDCGNEVVVKAVDVGRKKNSCGCVPGWKFSGGNRWHGMSKHPAHNVWMAIKNRCYLPSDAGYKNYGGRGITVCKRWRLDFANFWFDMGPTYAPGLMLERRKNSGSYNKRNCYWATRLQQNRNRRNNRVLDTPWGKMCLSAAAEKIGVHRSTLKQRIRKRWPYDMLFSPPDSTRQVVL